MRYFDYLEDRIRELCQYNPEDPLRKNEEQYLQFRDEIERHFAGELSFEQLSPCAAELIREWENIVSEEMNQESMENYEEAPEDFIMRSPEQ